MKFYEIPKKDEIYIALERMRVEGEIFYNKIKMELDRRRNEDDERRRKSGLGPRIFGGV